MFSGAAVVEANAFMITFIRTEQNLIRYMAGENVTLDDKYE